MAGPDRRAPGSPSPTTPPTVSRQDGTGVGPGRPDPDRAPSVICSHVDITYRVYGVGAESEGEEGALRRFLARSTQGIGIREVHAVRDVSFVAYPGESIGIIGRNGSGKSTLLRSIAGLVPPSKGTIWLNGKAALLGVGAVLMSELTGRQNVEIGMQAFGLSRREVRERMGEIIEFADIGEFIDLPMSTYSSGMSARLRFAISTAVVPEILVVDEALATGDAQFKERAAERIAQIRGQAGTVFLVSHNRSTIESMCNRVMWMDQGKLLADGDLGPVYGLYNRKYGKNRHIWRERYEQMHRVIEEQGLEAARELLRRWEPEGNW